MTDDKLFNQHTRTHLRSFLPMILRHFSRRGRWHSSDMCVRLCPVMKISAVCSFEPKGLSTRSLSYSILIFSTILLSLQSIATTRPSRRENFHHNSGIRLRDLATTKRLRLRLTSCRSAANLSFVSQCFFRIFLFYWLCVVVFFSVTFIFYWSIQLYNCQSV